MMKQTKSMASPAIDIVTETAMNRVLWTCGTVIGLSVGKAEGDAVDEVSASSKAVLMM